MQKSSPAGTLQYDTYCNDDETECIAIERFCDSDALIQHGKNPGPRRAGTGTCSSVGRDDARSFSGG